MKGNVRVKSFKGAKIDDPKHELAKKDLSRYENIVLHVGGGGGTTSMQIYLRQPLEKNTRRS